MCGIVALQVNNPDGLESNIYRIYQRQKLRGSDGFGIMLRKPDGKIKRVRTQTQDEIFTRTIWDEIEKGDLLAFHHRIPTSSPNIVKCNHPIKSRNDSLYMVHNGIINNYRELEKKNDFETAYNKKNKLKGYGFSWFTDGYTDSELALHRLCDLTETGKLNDSMKTLAEENWYSAFVIFSRDEHKIFFCSNCGSLTYYKLGDNHFISSQPFTISYENLESGWGFVENNRLTFNKMENIGYPYNNYDFEDPHDFSCGRNDEADDSSLELELGDNEYHTINSEPFEKYKRMVGCHGDCVRCEFVWDCMISFQESKDRERRNRVPFWEFGY